MKTLRISYANNHIPQYEKKPVISTENYEESRAGGGERQKSPRFKMCRITHMTPGFSQGDMRYQLLVNTKGMAISCYHEFILLISGKIVIKKAPEVLLLHNCCFFLLCRNCVYPFEKFIKGKG